jgi:pyruvyltransferase
MRRVKGPWERKLQARGGRNANNIFWSWYEPKNFGDWVTPFLFEKITGREAVHCPAAHLEPGATTVFGAGSILRHVKTADVAIVWGSGIISGGDTFERPKQTLLVRGPHTRHRMGELGYDCPPRYGDPALVLPHFLPAAAEKRFALGVIPHFKDLPHVRAMDLPPDWCLIDVTQSMETVTEAISACERTVSSSLHGVIVSHAYGVPSAWLNALSVLDGDGVKFQDYFASLGLAFEVQPGDWSGIAKGQTSGLNFLIEDVSALQADILDTCPFPPKDAATP